MLPAATVDQPLISTCHDSVSSAVCVMDMATTMHPESPKAQRRSSSARKRVRFDMECNEEHAPIFSMEEVLENSYTRKDFRKFRAQSGAMTKETLPSDFQFALLSIYHACCQVEIESENTVQDIESLPEFQRLQESFELSLSSRWYGLEKYSIRAISQSRESQRQDVMDIVLDLQMDCIFGESLCDEVRSISLPSRLFAAILAKAQAEALQNQERMRFFF